MSIVIRPMGLEDADAKGYVHWKSWQETYAGLMPERFLTGQTLEKCRDIARRWPENTLVVESDGTIVGYGCWGREAMDGEVIAIYLLKEAQGRGLGQMLMDALLRRLDGCGSIGLWVLKGNDQAIGFYEHYGFRLDGVSKELRIGTELHMVLNNHHI